MVTVIVVLGNTDTNIMNKRVDRAIEEFNNFYQKLEAKKAGKSVFDMIMLDKNFVCYLILSGGSKNGEISQAEYMRNYAVSHGIDIFYTIIETQGVNTEQNILFSRNIINSINPDDVVICTSSFHIKRAFYIARERIRNYRLRYIDTKEIVSKGLCKRESALLRTYIRYYNKF